MLAATCFDSCLPSSWSFWIRLGYAKNTDRYRGLSYNVVKWPVCRSAKVQSVALPSWEAQQTEPQHSDTQATWPHYMINPHIDLYF
jgi:hypothetical protein